jgi:hypothetical protein
MQHIPFSLVYIPVLVGPERDSDIVGGINTEFRSKTDTQINISQYTQQISTSHLQPTLPPHNPNHNSLAVKFDGTLCPTPVA